MSYLNPVRLHFAGRFQANVSTVNNDPAHFDNATFKPQYQNMQGPNMVPPNGWFNPEGDAVWRLLGCQVTSACTAAGSVALTDPVLGCRVADSDSKAPAKLVDLDSEQQLVSEIWGLQVRLLDATGRLMLCADYEPAAFMDIWDRATGSSGGDVGAGAMYQSVLTNLSWGDVSTSPFLTDLKNAASDGVLSIKFNVDGFNMDYTSPDFMTGRVVGTIGPSSASEPKHVLIARQFMAQTGAGGNFFKPAGSLNFCAAVVDPNTSCLYLDLGNALTTAWPGGPINDQGMLIVSVQNPNPSPASNANDAIVIGNIPSLGEGGYAQDQQWYGQTAGVVVLSLTADQMQAIANAPLTISGNPGVQVSEWRQGAFVRADCFVYRVSPDQTIDIPIVAMQWGQPYSGAPIGFRLDPSQLQPGSGFPYVAPSPPVGTPETALSFPAMVKTDAQGMATLTLSTTDPGTPRWFNGGYGIDGQVYGIRPFFPDKRDQGPSNQWNFISILLWSGFTPANPVTWDDLQPIFQQYANLYPVMNRFLNLADYKSVVANARLLSLAFGLNPEDPNAMPVTRDLSPAKRNAILSWLQKPLPGTSKPMTPPDDLQISRAAPAAAALADTTSPSNRGGKASAAARRLVLQSI